MKELQAAPRADLHRHLPRPGRGEVHGGPHRASCTSASWSRSARPRASTRTTVHPYTRALIDTIPEPDWPGARSQAEGHIRGELPSAINPPSGCRFRTRCPFAQEICAAGGAPLRPFGTGHLAACHFPLQTADRAAAPDERVPDGGRLTSLATPAGRRSPVSAAAGGPRASRAGRRRRS